jgi:hypothetical protein
MIKKREIFLFIMKKLTNNKLFILDGGGIKSLSQSHDLQYYYNNLEVYKDIISGYMESFSQNLRDVSLFVKSFGGSGRVHGSIVDIDFYNHLYINPFDGKITPYFATSIVDKYVYENIASLLYSKSKRLYKKFNYLLLDSQAQDKLSLNSALTNYIGNNSISKSTVFVSDTSMYKASRIAKQMQYLESINTVRIWNEELLQAHTNNRKISFALLIGMDYENT